MKTRSLLAALIVVVSMTLASAVSAHPSRPSIPLPAGFAPEDLALGKGNTFYTGSRSGQGVYRGDLQSGTGSIIVPGQAGQANFGMFVDDHNRLWVAGGPAGDARVYDADTGAELAAYQLGAAGSFVSDSVVTEHEAFFTDSFRPQLFAVALDRDGRLPKVPVVRTIPLTGDIVYTDALFGFNANGIAYVDGKLIVGQTNTGRLFSVDPATGVAHAIDLGGETVIGADGIQLVGHTLYISQNIPQLIAVVQLSGDLASGRVVKRISDPRLDTPSAVVAKGDKAFALNGRFFIPVTADTPYDIIVLPLADHNNRP